MPRVAVILNPHAGRGAVKKALPLIQRVMRKYCPDCSYFFTRSRGEAQALAEREARLGAKLIIAAGGDGTLHEVANGLINAECPDVALGLIPCGTGNDFARSVGLTNGTEAAVTALFDGHRSRIDVGRIDSPSLSRPNYFLVAAGVGFVADTAQAANSDIRFLSGPLAYLVAVLQTLRRFEPSRLTVAIDDMEPFEIMSTLLSISNVATTGGGIRIAPRAVPDDGKLDLCLVCGLSKARILGKLPLAYRGRHEGDPAVVALQAKSVRIQSERPLALWIDGEVSGQTPALFSILPGKVAMMLP